MSTSESSPQLVVVLDLLRTLSNACYHQHSVRLDGKNLKLSDLLAVARIGAACQLDESRKRALAESQAVLKRTLDSGKIVYGTNTMYGGNAAARSDTNTVSHALTALLYGILPAELTGADSPGSLPNTDHFESTVARMHALPTAWVRASMVLRLNSFLRGHSAVRWLLVETLAKMIEAEITPLIPSQGSISASGDLSPLAYVAYSMAGNPSVQVLRGKGPNAVLGSSAETLRSAHIQPVKFSPKEVLAVTNGTSVSCAVAAHNLADMHILIMLAQLITAACAEAMLACTDSFDAFLSDECRPHPGQIEIAANLRSFLQGSKLVHGNNAPASPLGRCLQLALALSDAEAEELSGIGMGFFLQQDRYPLRTAPQWLGPPLEDLMHAHRTLTIEINSATDNPLIAADPPRVLHGGNFQAVAVTNASEKTRDVAAYIGKLLFAQQEELINPALSSGLPSNLTLGEPSAEGTFKGVSIGNAALTSELAYLASRANHFAQSAEMHNQSINSLALISARSTAASVETLTKLICHSALGVCQALDLRACFILHLKLLGRHLSEWFGLLGDPTSAGPRPRDAATLVLHKLVAALTLPLMQNMALDSIRRAEIAGATGARAILNVLLQSNEFRSDGHADKIAIATLLWSAEGYLNPGRVRVPRVGDDYEIDRTESIIRVLEPALARLVQDTFEQSRDAYFRASRARRGFPGESTPLHLIGKGAAALYGFVRFDLGIKMHRSVLLDQPGLERDLTPAVAKGLAEGESSDQRRSLGGDLSVLYEGHVAINTTHQHCARHRHEDRRSDAGRRDLTDQIGSNLKPDSQKSILEQGKEKLDSAASSLQPESQKSTTQKIGDSVSGNSNENQDSLLSKAKQTLGLDNSKST
ncbi:hypothetical protein OC846_004480 [Tilletia horrida]|uniref:Phenylalanine ammonia-lyase n=1 Tax=Tilletia horrida TaxID=155126 RepID=A0AAN6JSR7_9BASI|nr:hypothetical protein OC846_004480 [Tilletia horrida]